jgi:hypothetical protein
VDCANGVGYHSLKSIQEPLQDLLRFEARNTGSGGLNHNCGADYVQKAKSVPHQPYFTHSHPTHTHSPCLGAHHSPVIKTAFFR